MTESRARAVLLEDDASDRRLAERLSSLGLECVALEPPTSVEALTGLVTDALGDASAPLVLLDYRLDDVVQQHGNRALYRGGTAAAYLREQLPVVPLVLVTTESRWHEWVEGNPAVQGLFDYTVLKEQVSTRARRQIVVRQLASIATGYARVVTAWPATGQFSFDMLSDLLASPDAEVVRNQLGSISLPKSPHSAATWLLNVVLALPGLFLESADAAATLGIESSTFERDDVQSLAAPARYVGVFGDAFPRWWRASLLALARDFDHESRDEGAARGIAAALGVDLRTIRRATCTWCGEAHVDRSCSSCGELVGRGHWVPIEESDRPKWAMPDVVCFSCIESGRADGLPMAAAYSRVVDQVRSGEARASL